MNFKLKPAAATVLAACLVASFAFASNAAPPVKKHAIAKKAKTPPPPSVADQIQALKDQLEGEINSLKTSLADKDAQLKQAQQAAADAQAAADKAQAAASAQNQAVTDNAAAVTTLQSTVVVLKGNQASLANTFSEETAKIKKDINAPSVLHYKGVTLTPIAIVMAETDFRTKATGGGITTAFNAIPYEGADAYQLSEFDGGGRQSRLALLAEGKTNWGTMKGYYEGDFLGVGATSNNNQTNSYVFRQRVIYASVQTNNGWTFGAGQLWSLVAEGKKGIVIGGSPDVNSPQNIDPSYVAGFIYARQYGARVIKSFPKAAFAFSAENPQLLYTASLAGNTPYAVLGNAGTNGGLYNAAISTCTPATSIVNYTNQAENNSTGGVVDVAIPVYKTLNGCADLATISFNQAPDLHIKAAFDPGIGHYEVFGIAGFAHETVYPGETTTSNLYGGNKEVSTGVAVAPALTTAGYFNNSLKVGGMGASARVPLIANVLSVGAKALYGPGVGRYSASTLADVTSNAAGELRAIHNLSGLLTVEVTPNPRVMLWADYGGDYAGRDDYATSTATTLAAPTAEWCLASTVGTATPTCTASPTAAQILAGGAWGAHWGTPSAAAVGYGSRLLSNSACGVVAAPGYNGGASTGYAAGGSCGAQNRDVQEVTGGYWYDFYKGDHGRLRQGIQYSYIVREGWSGASGLGAKGIDNMVFTSFRYYLP
jgi:hypothetical protein